MAIERFRQTGSVASFIGVSLIRSEYGPGGTLSLFATNDQSSRQTLTGSSSESGSGRRKCFTN